MAVNKKNNNNVVPAPIAPKSLPDNYVDIAENHMRKYMERTPPKRRISTTKIRNFMGLLTDSYRIENRNFTEKITSESIEALDMLRIRVIDEMRRDKTNYNNNVGPFIREMELQEYLMGIRENRKALVRFYHYMEALVAYHGYLGGREG